MIIRLFHLALAAVLAVTSTSAQTAAKTNADDPCKPVLDNIVAKASAGIDFNSDQAFSNAFAIRNITDFTRFLGSCVGNAVNKAQNNLTQTQTAAAASSAGSTSIAQHGGVAQILSFAVDNGGLQREVSGTTITFRGNPVGFLEAFKKYDLLDILANIEASDTKRFLNRFSFAVAFDTSRGTTPNTLLANSQQVASWSGKVELVNHRSAAARRYAALWRKLSQDSATAVGASEQEFFHKLEQWTELTDWFAKLHDEFVKMDPRAKDLTQKDKLLGEFRDRISKAATELGKLQNRPEDLDPALSKVIEGWSKMNTKGNQIMDFVQKGTLVTFDWTTKRDPSLPDLYSNTVVWEFSPAKTRVDDFTFNAAANWYHVAPKQPAGTGRFKDFNAVGEYSFPIGNVDPIGKFILSFTAKYQYVAASVVNATSLTTADMTSKATTSSTADSGSSVISTTPPTISNLLPTLKGHLGAFQVKLSIPGGKSGVRIPLAFTAATRSEVFNKPDYRVNIGIAFNIDALFAK